MKIFLFIFFVFSRFSATSQEIQDYFYINNEEEEIQLNPLEIENDMGINNQGKGDLTKWAEQGILLLNATLTVRANEAGSHQNKGWEQFTDKVISTISQKKERIVFLLWGKFAQNKSKLIDKEKHHILMSSHPSPLSSYRGFLGCKHFSECNNILKREMKSEINWQL